MPGQDTPGSSMGHEERGYEQGGQRGYEQGGQRGYEQGGQRGYEQGGQRGYEQGQTTTQVAGRESYEAAPRRHGAGARAEHRGAVIVGTAAAGGLMLLSGLMSIFLGIVALSTTHLFVHSPVPGYTYRWSLHGWGWAEVIFGIVLFAAGLSVFLGMAWARYLGAALAIIGAVGNFMLLPFTPLWAIILIALNAYIVWALLAPRRVAGQL